ncbi:MAG: hypothetical protein Edafosvirus16_16 [Edafosvirus sp.]|uniref:Uncharacterized protein n=1 Tax=Edafosvirus sp. TaxID=2487765 RepID=A0A3G4ZUE9_9VIRU|nr:MAG: hypothetical protein Edafosvirus16_16 [Edafosvirus sp.]
MKLYLKQRKLKKTKIYKLKEIFHCKDMLYSIVEFADETDKMQIYRVNKKFRNFITTSKLCPIYYNFNSDFFVNNISNEKIINIYVSNVILYSRKLTFDFLKNYCSCKPGICYSLAKNCASCYIYNFNGSKACFVNGSFGCPIGETGRTGATGATGNTGIPEKSSYQKLKYKTTINNINIRSNIKYKKNYR